jgi:hypothetical protein
MTKAEKRKFIRELIGSVQAGVLAQVERMPAEWDGIELRQYIADRFSAQTWRTSWSKLTGADHRRKQDYENEVLVRGL